MRQPTNTLILTELDSSLLNNPSNLLEYISQHNNNLIELIVLIKFSRILIICESSSIATDILNLLKSSPFNIRISYSLRDNKFNLNQSDLTINHLDQDMQYLELPSEAGSRRFLISPPLSPPAEWDHWDKVEEGPNQKTLYSPEELSHLLWERLGGFDSEFVRRFQGDEGIDQGGDLITNNGNNGISKRKVKLPSTAINIKREPELLFQDIKENGVPAIILDTTNNADIEYEDTTTTLIRPPTPLPKTSLPPPL